MMETLPVNSTLAAQAATPIARLLREPLPCGRSLADVPALLADEPLPFALTGAWAGGGAIAGSDPIAVAGDGDDPFTVLDRLPTVAHDPHRPPDAVGGGWFGWLGYRLAHRVERVPRGPPRPVALPDFHLAYYDNVVRRDAGGQWWFEALVTPGRETALRARLQRLRALLGAAPGHTGVAPPPPLVLDRADAAHHLEAVAACRRRIAAGEIFQANLCVRLHSQWGGTGAQLLASALENGVSPAHAACFDTPRGSIASLSPELFLRRRQNTVVSAPIKGTAPRSSTDPDAAAAALLRLRASAKDAAEHVMIVDLMRNDLGRVARYGSVTAARHPTAEAHPELWHLVSRVRAELRPGTPDGDVLRATFPPGSVTGAPKVQALRVIAELESAGREVYTGAIGYASPLAGLELNVAIRTLELRDGALWLGAGGGIVADSDPERELEEALVKARSVAGAIGATVAIGP
jgi:para-aminobenzoate synthetase/4-amino-4-deoxychorismate lyase